MLSRYRLISAALVASASLTLLSACPSPVIPPASDPTPPGFADVTVTVTATTSPPSRGTFTITSQDVSRVGLGPDLTLRISALAGDPESGITGITFVGELTWQCQLGQNSPIIGSVQTAPLSLSSVAPPTGPMSTLQVNVTADPVAQTGCARMNPGEGAINIRGFVRATAVNGLGTTVSSGTFIFDFADALGRVRAETPYMAECRAQGVPIPPDWRPTTRQWKPHGSLAQGTNLLAPRQPGRPGHEAFVWTYTDPRIRGACIALPRGAGGSRGGLAGIICQSASTGAACFWDSRRRNDAVPLAEVDKLDWAIEELRVDELKDATNLTENGSGICTDCHQGNNVFLMAPDDPVWRTVMRANSDGSLGRNFSTRVLASTDNRGGMPRYVPVTGVQGATRPGWQNLFVGPGCGGACHEESRLPLMLPSTPSPNPPMPPVCATGGDHENCYR